MWRPVDAPWQFRVLDALPPGIDLAQLEQQRRMTPTERVEAAQKLLELAEAVWSTKTGRRP
jgi:hypothetical protein